MEQMRNATPQQRQQMRIDGWMGMVTRTYDLKENQKDNVREELARIVQERTEEMGEDGEKLSQLRQKMGDFWQDWRARREAGKAATGNPMEDPRFRQLRDRMGELMEQHPFNWRQSIERIESLLPKEQVEMGRKRRSEWMQRMEQMRTARENNGQQTNSPAQASRFAQMRERMQTWRARNEQAHPGIGSEAGDGRSSNDGSTQRRPSSENLPPKQPPAPPQHPWDIYTNHFIKDYRLDAGQVESAAAILQDLKTREAKIRQRQTSERLRLHSLDSTKDSDIDATSALKKLNQPINVLFEELKKRLDALLTTEQRERGEAPHNNKPQGPNKS